MKRVLIATAILSFMFTLTSFAAQNEQPNEPAATFEQKQARILKMFDDRITSLQEAKTCVQAAKNNDDLRACRKKYMAEIRERQGDKQQHRGTMGGPQDGMGGPQGQ
ncbi:MAG TPA: hypothetical protein VL122_06125 [Nitrospirota bacterium]|nr:hypothetical protein [Nitrospirota bacterium]